MNSDITELAKQTVEALARSGKTLATAESCTGGMLGELITSVPGASDVYGFGFITYANEAKQRLIGVKPETLAAVGAVSSSAAAEMAQGAKRVSGADIAVSVTGIAGPGGGTPEKPVGLVYIAAAYDGGGAGARLMLSGTRSEVRRQTCCHVFEMILKILQKMS